MTDDGHGGLRNTSPVTVLLIDDHARFRRVAEWLLTEYYADEITVLGAASIGPDGLRLVDRLQPQVILVGLGLPAATGLAFVRQLRMGGRRMGIIGLGLLATTSYEQAVQSVGADAFVRKDDLNTHLLAIVREVMRHRSPEDGSPASGRRERFLVAHDA